MSPRVILRNSEVGLLSGETVLAALQRVGIPTLFSCESGYCQGCILRAVGPVPPESQNGLSRDLKSCGCFLACRCIPTQDIKVFLPGERPVS